MVSFVYRYELRRGEEVVSTGHLPRGAGARGWWPARDRRAAWDCANDRASAWWARASASGAALAWRRGRLIRVVAPFRSNARRREWSVPVCPRVSAMVARDARRRVVRVPLTGLEPMRRNRELRRELTQRRHAWLACVRLEPAEVRVRHTFAR